MSERNFFLQGVRFSDPRLTRNPRIWWAYLCWCLYFQMTRVGFWEPLWLLRWRWQRTGHATGRKHIKWLHGPWQRLCSWVAQQRLGLSHRCEFTDPESGALYTGTADPYMERIFQQFIRRITPGGQS